MLDSELAARGLCRSFPGAVMGKDKYICPCFKVTKADIKKQIADGAGSFKEVKKANPSGGRCGHCTMQGKKYRRNGWEMFRPLKDVGTNA